MSHHLTFKGSYAKFPAMSKGIHHYNETISDIVAATLPAHIPSVLFILTLKSCIKKFLLNENTFYIFYRGVLKAQYDEVKK